jgi:hypothetical protein
MNQSSEEVPVPLPPVLYKYYEFNEWTEAIFEKNEIYFQSPDCFNDPFDTKIAFIYEGTEQQRITRLIEFWQAEAAKGKSTESLHEEAEACVKAGRDIDLISGGSRRLIERIRKRFGVFCMTEAKNNLLMWSHYADSHRGFCLGFSTQEEFFGAKRAFPIEKRHYRIERPCINLIAKNYKDQIVDALLIKHKPWEYEAEWRIIDKKGAGLQEFPKESLVEVILGCKIDPENRNRIMAWCRARTPRPSVYWAEEIQRRFELNCERMKWE